MGHPWPIVTHLASLPNPLYTAPALGLLTGPGDRVACKFVGAVLTAKILTAPARFAIKRNHLRESGCLATRFWDVAC